MLEERARLIVCTEDAAARSQRQALRRRGAQVTMSTDETGEPGQGAGNRRRWVRPAVAAATLALVGGIAVTAGHVTSLTGGKPLNPPTADGSGQPGNPGSNPGSADQDKTVSSDPVDVPKQESGPVTRNKSAESNRAAKAATALVSSMNQIGTRADGSSVGVESIATGFVLGEIQALAQERRDLGYKQAGEAEITQVKASKIDLDGKPPTMTLTVCVDVSSIKVTDAAGNAMATYDPGRPVKHVYGAEFIGNSWKISTHDIPNKQNCEPKS